MKKKISLVYLCLLTGAAFANPNVVGTTVYVQPMTHAMPNQSYYISTNHAYSIQNDSGIEQIGTVCFTTTLCYNAKNPGYHKIIQSCDKFDLKPSESKHDIKYTSLPFNYPFNGYCDVTATTEVFGWQHSLATARGKLHVGNDV